MKQIQPTHKKANISTKNALYFELGTEWNAEKDLKDLIQLTVFQNEDMERFMTFMPNVTNGKKAGFINRIITLSGQKHRMRLS